MIAALLSVVGFLLAVWGALAAAIWVAYALGSVARDVGAAGAALAAWWRRLRP